MHGDGENENHHSKKKLEGAGIPTEEGGGGVQGMASLYEIRKINALLRFHFKMDPDLLSDEEWAISWEDLKWALENEAKRTNQNNTL